jgi:hypothetical protein
MASNELRAFHLSRYTEIDAGDEFGKSLEPLLAIPCVTCSPIVYQLKYLIINMALYQE